MFGKFWKKKEQVPQPVLVEQPSESKEIEALIKEIEKEKKEVVPSYQQHVIEESDQLRERLQKLTDFIGGNEIFTHLPQPEQKRLKEQRFHMGEYLNILDARIAAFTKEAK